MLHTEERKATQTPNAKILTNRNISNAQST